MTRYTTRDEAITAEIVDALGDHAADHDIDGIANHVTGDNGRRLIEFFVDHDDTTGEELLNTAGFECTVDADEFWKIAAEYEHARA